MHSSLHILLLVAVTCFVWSVNGHGADQAAAAVPESPAGKGAFLVSVPANATLPGHSKSIEQQIQEQVAKDCALRADQAKCSEEVSSKVKRWLYYGGCCGYGYGGWGWGK